MKNKLKQLIKPFMVIFGLSSCSAYISYREIEPYFVNSNTCIITTGNSKSGFGLVGVTVIFPFIPRSHEISEVKLYLWSSANKCPTLLQNQKSYEAISHINGGCEYAVDMPDEKDVFTTTYSDHTCIFQFHHVQYSAYYPFPNL